MSRSRIFVVSLVLCSAAFLAGCSSEPKREGVSGIVTYKGEPIKSGLISFVQIGSTASSGGAPITDGKYEVPASAGLLPGEYEVIISVPTAAPLKAAEDDEGPGEGGEKQTAETLPAKYNRKSELRAEVKAGEKNEFNFQLK